MQEEAMNCLLFIDSSVPARQNNPQLCGKCLYMLDTTVYHGDAVVDKTKLLVGILTI